MACAEFNAELCGLDLGNKTTWCLCWSSFFILYGIQHNISLQWHWPHWSSDTEVYWDNDFLPVSEIQNSTWDQKKQLYFLWFGLHLCANKAKQKPGDSCWSTVSLTCLFPYIKGLDTMNLVHTFLLLWHWEGSLYIPINLWLKLNLKLIRCCSSTKIYF